MYRFLVCVTALLATAAAAPSGTPSTSPAKLSTIQLVTHGYGPDTCDSPASGGMAMLEGECYNFFYDNTQYFQFNTFRRGTADHGKSCSVDYFKGSDCVEISGSVPAASGSASGQCLWMVWPEESARLVCK